MPLPSSPLNGAVATVNNVTYVYNSTKGAWTRANTTAGLSNSTLNVSNIIVGSTATFSNLQLTNVGDVSANIGAYQTFANANIVAYQSYANTKIGTNTNSNLVVVATTASADNTSGALVVKGGVGVTGNINLVYNPVTATGAAIQATGKDTQGGTGWFDFLKATNTTSGATNPNKSFRLNSTGGIEVINSAYTATLMSLSDAGSLNVSGNIQISGKKAVNGPAFSAYADATLQTITSGSQQKVLFQVEDFDTDNCYTNSRFTPTVEGYYQLNAEVRLDGSSGTGEIMIVLYKNTSEHKRGTNQSGTSIATNFFAQQVSSVVYANGTTDYFEIKVQQTSGGSMTVTAVNNPAITWFNGCMIRGA